MPYHITVRQHGSLVPTSSYRNCDFIDMLRFAYRAIKQCPEDQGYTITIARVGSAYPPVERKSFLEPILTSNEDSLLALFFHQDEYEQFVSQKMQTQPHDLKSKSPYYNLEAIKNVEYVLVYPGNLHILSVYPFDRDPALERKEWLLPWYPKHYTSDSLIDLEKILYNLHLTDGW